MQNVVEEVSMIHLNNASHLTQQTTTNENVTIGTSVLENQSLESIKSMTATARNDDVCISPNNRYDDILTNINKSNKRLRHKLANMPPLPKYTSYKPPSSTHCTSNLDFKKPHCAQCASKMATIGGDKAFICSRTAHSNSRNNSQHCCHCHGHKQTNPLPHWQQHLVLKQTFKNCSNEKQHPVHCTELTGSAETNTLLHTAVEERCTKNLSPQCYFQELLMRNNKSATSSQSKRHKDLVGCSCRKTRPPVKVDINVRLVPKTSNKLESVKPTVEESIDIAQHTIEELEKLPKDIELDMQSTQL